MTARLFDQLSAGDPAKKMVGYDDADIRVAARSICAKPVDDEAPSRSRQGKVATRWSLRLAPVAAVAAAALIVAPALSRDPSVSAEAATVLNQAADNITAVDPTAEPGQWWEFAWTGFSLAGDTIENGVDSSYTMTIDHTSYVSVDNSESTIWVDPIPTFVEHISGPPPSPQGYAYQFSPEDSSVWRCDEINPSQDWFSPILLAELPRETSALRERIYAEMADLGRQDDNAAFGYISEMLTFGPVPADLRSALYRVLATIPGVEITAQSATVDGSEGVAFGMFDSSDGVRSEIVVDPTTGDYVGQREVLVSAGTEFNDQYDPFEGVPLGTVISQSSITRTLVDAPPAEVTDNVEVRTCSDDFAALDLSSDDFAALDLNG